MSRHHDTRDEDTGSGTTARLAAAVLALLAGLMTVATAPPADAAPDGLSVMTWNIQGSNLSWDEVHGDGPETIVARIRAAGVDYVGLQEVSGDQANTIAVELGWGTGPEHVLTQHEHGGLFRFREGIAMISRYPMTDRSNVALVPEGRGRHVQQATITKDGARYRVFNTHLGSDDWSSRWSESYNPRTTDEGARAEQARFVRDRIAGVRSSSDPADVFVVTGDLNSRAVADDPRGWAYRTLTFALTDTWLQQQPAANTPDPGITECHRPECGNTVSIRDGDDGPTLNPTARIDFILLDVANGASASGGVTPEPSNATENDYNNLSDHFPYRTVISPR